MFADDVIPNHWPPATAEAIAVCPHPLELVDLTGYRFAPGVFLDHSMTIDFATVDGYAQIRIEQRQTVKGNLRRLHG